MDKPTLPLIDPIVYGRLVKAARIMAGYDRVTDAAAGVTRKTGVKMSDRTLYSIERGSHVPSIEQYMALLLTYSPPTGDGFFMQCFREDVRERLAFTWGANLRGDA